MGKPARNASTSGSGSASVEIKVAVMEALTDSTVLATLAERVADAVFAKFEKRMSAFESELLDKDQRIELLEKTVTRMEGQIDAQEQYSRRTSVRISGVDEARGGEDVGSIVESILDKCNSASLSMANVNRAHRIGQSQRNLSQHGKPRARQIIVQFKDYDSKVEVMRSRKMLRNAMPNVYVNEDLTQVRSALLFKARALKREKRLTDCWSYDGRIVVKDNDSRITTVTSEVDLAAVCPPNAACAGE